MKNNLPINDIVDYDTFVNKNTLFYLEIQYHGNLTYKDVESIAFPYDVTTSQYKDVALRWKEAGVKVFFIKNDNLYEL